MRPNLRGGYVSLSTVRSSRGQQNRSRLHVSRSRNPHRRRSRPSNWSQESPFYIPMTGPAARPRRSLKHDDTFIVLDSHGDIGASAGGPDGLFNADTRYLARLELVLDDVQPLLLGSNLRDDNSALTVDLTNPDIYRDGRIVLQKDMLHIVRTIFLWRGTAYQRIGLQNHGDRPASIRPDAAVRQRFRRSVRGARREASAPRHRLRASCSARPTSRWNISGLDGDAANARRCISIRGRRGLRSMRRPIISIWRRSRSPRCSSRYPATSRSMHKPAPFFRGLLAHRREMRRLDAGATSIETSNNIFNEVLCQSMADLNMLMTETPQGRYPYAGIPWYSTTFGRDGLITALQMLWIDPRIARGVLKRLAVLSGKIGRSARRRRSPAKSCTKCAAARWRRCARCRSRNITAASMSTPLFVLLAGLYVERTGDDETLAELWPAIEAALRLDRRRRRSGRRRLCRISARLGTGACQSGLEGFLRRDLSCRRTTRRGLHRARRSAGLRVCRQAAGGALRAAPRSDGPGAQARGRGAARLPNASRKRSGARNSAPTRWRSMAPSSRARCGPRMPDSLLFTGIARPRTARVWSPPT